VKVLLDTNAYSALRRGHELVADRVRNAEEVLVSIVVVGELLFGFRNGSRYEENAQALRAFLAEASTTSMPSSTRPNGAKPFLATRRSCPARCMRSCQA
jgi:tRNA(fMet)-specific endonuclease VapC